LLGRFLTQDPLREEGGSWNFYNYCDGDPLNRLDPDGELIFTILAVVAIGAIAMGGAEYIRQKSNNEVVNPNMIAKKAALGGFIGLVGAAVGAVAGAGAAAVIAGKTLLAMAGVGFVEGFVGSVAEQCVENKIENKPYDWPKMLKEGTVDGAIGAGISVVTPGLGFAARRVRKGLSEGLEAAAKKVPKRAPAKGTGHAKQRHGPNRANKYKNKSHFDNDADVDTVLKESDTFPAKEASNGNTVVVFESSVEGTSAGARTKTMTVITKPDGTVITAHPGTPYDWNSPGAYK
jgi:hypothetical protein